MTIAAHILRQGLVVVAMGILVGVAIAIGLSRLASGLLFGVHPNSPWIYLAVVLVIVLSTLLSSLVPTKRAMSIDVVATLKGD